MVDMSNGRDNDISFFNTLKDSREAMKLNPHLDIHILKLNDNKEYEVIEGNYEEFKNYEL